MSEYCEHLTCYGLSPCSRHQELQNLMDEGLSSWEYVNEGAVNMVFRYVARHPQLRLRAIRLSKNLLANPLSAEHARVVRVSHEYTEHVISKLLGAEYVDAGEVVSMSVSAAMNLVLASTSLRLPSRLCVHPLKQMQSACEEAGEAKIPVLLMLDMAHLPDGGLPDRPTFSIEIKPKWGFLPHSRFIDDEHHIKRHVCRYCMMQLHKAKESDGGMPSRFCPLDIYSGDKSRVCRALCHLIKNPQNNFRVAWRSPQDAQVRQALPSSSPDSFDEALKVLFSKPESSGRDLRGRFVELVAALILNPFTSRLMRRLQQTQIDFDMFDIEGTRYLYELLLLRSSTLSTEAAVQWARKAVQVYSEAGKLERPLWKPRRNSAHRYFAASNFHPFALHYASSTYPSLSPSSPPSSPPPSSPPPSSLSSSNSSFLISSSSSSPVCNNAIWLSSMATHASLDPHEDLLWQVHLNSERELHNEVVTQVPEQLKHHARLSSLLQSRRSANRSERKDQSESKNESTMDSNDNMMNDSGNSGNNSGNSGSSDSSLSSNSLSKSNIKCDIGGHHRSSGNCSESGSKVLQSPWTLESWGDSSAHDLVLAVAEFLISSTVKDLSLMFTFQLQDSDEGVQPKVLWRMCAIDLDPKDPKKIPHYYTLDRNIVHYYMKQCKPN